MEENQYSLSFYRAGGIILDASLCAAPFKLKIVPVRKVLSSFTQQIRKLRLREEVAH